MLPLIHKGLTAEDTIDNSGGKCQGCYNWVKEDLRRNRQFIGGRLYPTVEMDLSLPHPRRLGAMNRYEHHAIWISCC